ncbi:hypothetical protein RUND412_006178 [Rhizina undulata]
MDSMPGTFYDSSNSSATLVNSTPEKKSTYLKNRILSRRDEYVKQRSIRIKIGSWNVASMEGVHVDLAEWLIDNKRDLSVVRMGNQGGELEQDGVDDDDQVGIYAIALQEVVDITATETFIKYTDPKVALNWKAYAQAALPVGYTCVASPQIIGVLLMVFVSPRLLPLVSSASISTVGTGVMGYIGNKGGAGARVVIGDTLRLVFIDCHLAASAEATERRNWDAAEIIRRMVFEPVSKDVIGLGFEEDIPQTLIAASSNSIQGENLDKADVIFWCGDLNYRLDLPNEDIRRLLSPYMPKDLPPTHAEGPMSPLSPRRSPSFEQQPLPPLPTEVHPDAIPTLEGTIDSLLKHDQLYKQQKEKKVLVGFREGKIGFLPSYKYEVGSVGLWDSSKKVRAPSWCDRILWRVNGEEDENSKALGRERARSRGLSVSVIFENDPDEEDLVVSRAVSSILPNGQPPVLEIKPPKPPVSVLKSPSGEVKLEQTYYISYPNITTSDHKPVSSLFKLSFPSVDIDLKAKVHAEIAREIDKMENERRPVVTVVIDPVEGQETEEGVIEFGEVRFWEARKRSITVANTGTSTAKIYFASRSSPDDEKKEIIAKHWLDVHFWGGRARGKDATAGIELDPGDACNIMLTMLVENVEDVRKLNEKRESLDDVLVLRVEDGRDVFLPVGAKWAQSGYGRGLAELVRVPEGVGGIREWGKKAVAEGNVLFSTPDPLFSTPRELHKIREFLLEKMKEIVKGDCKKAEENGGDVKGKRWYKNVGWPFTEDTWSIEQERRRSIVVGVWEFLDRDIEFDHSADAIRVVMEQDDNDVTKEEMVEVVAGVLMQWLKGLREGVVPEEMWDDVIKAGGDKKLQDEILQQLSEKASKEQTYVFIYFTGFIGEMLSILSYTSSQEPQRTSKESTRTLFQASEASQENKIDGNAPSPPPPPAAPTVPAPTALKRISTSFSMASFSPPGTPLSPTVKEKWGQNGRETLLKQKILVAFAEAIIRRPAGRKVLRSEEERRKEFLRGFLEI